MPEHRAIDPSSPTPRSAASTSAGRRSGSGKASAHVSRLLAPLLPRTRPTGEDELFRLEFAVTAVWIAVVVALCLVPFNLASVPMSAATLGVGALTFAGVGVALRLGAAPRPAFWTLAIEASIAFVVMGYFEGGADIALVCWSAVLPLATTLFDGTRAGFLGLGLGIATAIGLLCVGELRTHPEGPAATLSAIRGISLVVTMFLFALASERMRSAALVRAQAATRARTYFLASMSHEFRTPMNGVIGLADSMLERPRAVEDHEALQLIKRSANQLLGLIGDTLDLASLEAGRLAVKTEPTAIERLAHDALDLTGAAFRGDGVALRVEVAEQVPPWLELDPQRVRQVLTNLVGNALKFTTRGEVAVHITTVGQTLAIDVSDTGVGIPAAELERVFEPFEQVRGHERYIGHGLGLAITRQLVELMGGSIALESDLGRGTRVAVRLPLVPTAAPAPVDGALERSARASAAAVLVVDDNEINLRVAAALVRRAGFQVQLARDGREALRAVETQPFALVLMDCHMPEMDGFEATRCIRLLNSSARTTPIIAVTANALPEERERCLAAGMNACATKPLTLADLERAFGEALSA